MKNLLIILVFLIPVASYSQIVVRGDTVIRVDPQTGVETVVLTKPARFLKLTDTALFASRFLTTELAAQLYQPVGNYLTQNDLITLSGHVTGSGRTSINTVISNGVVTNAMLSGSIAFSKLIGSDISISESQVTGLSAALALKAPLASPTFTGTVSGITASMVGLGNVTNESKATMFASPSFTTPNIDAATATSLQATGAIKSSGTAGIGYSTGAGGTVTQATNKSTGVTLNKITGEITLSGAALAAATIVSFTLTNSTIAATDVLILNHVTTGTRGAYGLNAQCAAGSAIIYVRNNSAGSLSEAIVIRFAVIKGVNN